MDTTPTAPASAAGSTIRFGPVPLEAAAVAFRRDMNREVMDLLWSLPASVHTDAVVLLMEHFHAPFFPEFNYFQNYHAPAWSILYWLEKLAADRGLSAPPLRRKALQVHAMALFLHPLDDHLNDGQLPASHLNILLRSQAWLRMNTALEALATGVPDGAGMAQTLIDAYYAAIGTPPAEDTLDGYCIHFRHQMATWMIAPVLVAAGMMLDENFPAALQSAYGAFGTAWRLVDDLQDVDADLAAGHRSAVYYLLPPEIRDLWDRVPAPGRGERQDAVRAAILQEGLMETLEGRILKELARAARAMEALAMPGLADELHGLARPIADGQGRA